MPMQNNAIIGCMRYVDMRREIVENTEDDLVVSLSLFHVQSSISHDVYVVILHIL